jgi:hypothetical protein
MGGVPLDAWQPYKGKGFSVSEFDICNPFKGPVLQARIPDAALQAGATVVSRPPHHVTMMYPIPFQLVTQDTAGLGGIAVGSFGACTNSASEIFFNDAPMTLARYPNIRSNGSWAWLSIGNVSNCAVACAA